MQFLYLIALVVFGCVVAILAGAFLGPWLSLLVLIVAIVHVVIDGRLEAYIEGEAQKYPVEGASWSDWRVMEQVYANKPWIRIVSRYFWIDGLLRFVTYGFILFVVIGIIIRLVLTS